jgi:hypothetical protein
MKLKSGCILILFTARAALAAHCLKKNCPGRMEKPVWAATNCQTPESDRLDMHGAESAF